MRTQDRTNEDSANDNARATKVPSKRTLAKRDARSAATLEPRRALVRDWGPAILATFFLGRGPDFDLPSLVTTTRVVGARVEAPGTNHRVGDR